MPTTPKSTPPAAQTYRTLSPFERDERNLKIIQWHYVYSWPIRVIAGMLEREAADIRKKGGIPAAPLREISVRKVIDQYLRKKATADALDAREAQIRARMRYEHIFQHILGLLRRQYKPAVIDPATKNIIEPAVHPLDDRDAIQAARTAAQVQSMLDRVSGLSNGNVDEIDFDGSQPQNLNPIAICKSIVKMLDGQPEMQDQVKNAFTTGMGLNNRIPLSSPEKRSKPTRRSKVTE